MSGSCLRRWNARWGMGLIERGTFMALSGPTSPSRRPNHSNMTL